MTVSFDRLNLKKQHRYIPDEIKALQPVGLDTETNPDRNLCELIAAETGDYIHPCSFEDIARWCLNTRKFRGKSFVFYNLQFDTQAILKWLHPDRWADLWELGETEYDGFTLQLIPWKVFKIKLGKKTASFYDIAQFFNYLTLDTAAKRYLGDEKIKTVDRMALDLKSQETIDYCVHDAKLAGDLARFILDLHTEHFPDSPQSLVSKAAVSEKHFTTCSNIPVINNLIEEKPEWIKVAYNTYKGGFFQAFKKGYFDRLRVYDINSAYPYHMSKLPNIREGFFRQSKRPLKEAILGWMECMVEVYDDRYGYFNPIAIDHKNTRFYPTGLYQTFITLSEYRELSPYYYIEPINTINWIPDTWPMEYPYKSELERLYRWKQVETDPALKMYVKIVLNSIYGKTIQKVPDHQTGLYNTGNLFNPFYASYITAETRLQIFRELIKMNVDDIVMIATDSIITKGELPVDLDDRLGNWGIEKDGPGVIIGSGVYSIADNETGNVTTKRRGFRADSKLNFLTPDQIPHINTDFVLDVKLHYSMARALISKDYEKMNLIMQDSRRLNINFDYRRFWHNSFDTINQLLYKQIDSSPLDYQLILNY